MKIAILSDIHGNIVAFNKVIEDAKKNGVKKYVILGDMLTDFPATNEIIDKIREITPHVIRGNRENYLLEYEKTKQDDKWKKIQNSSVSYYYHKLRRDNIEYIKSLQENLSLNFEGVKVKAVHGSPYRISQLLYFHDLALVNKVFEDLQEDLLVYGHNHEITEYREKNKKVILQSGPIGMHNNQLNIPQYAIINCNNGRFTIEKRQVAYDKEELKRVIKNSDILSTKAKTWQNLCFYCIATGKDIRTSFIRDAKLLMEEKYKGIIQEGIYQDFITIDDDIYLKLSKEYEKYFLL